MNYEKDGPPAQAAHEGPQEGQAPKPDAISSAASDAVEQSSSVLGDSDAAVDFLRGVYPRGPWLLTAISPDEGSKKIETRTFSPGIEHAMRAWLEKYNGQWNLYWSVNPPTRELTKKASVEEIQEVCYLHVDCDPRAGEDIQAERDRIHALLTSKLPPNALPPSFVIFSGGGYQAFWKLLEPIPIEGDAGRAEMAKRYNQQLELLFGADRCHNIDRVMRLPFTVNVPDLKKRKKGRVSTLAALAEWHDDRVYSITAFTPVAAPRDRATSATAVDVQKNVPRVSDLAELNRWGVPERVKVIIAQGSHPEESKEADNSRSAWLFDAICNLLRCAVPDAVIFSIITDSEWPISKSVLEKGGTARIYAEKQIKSAKEKIAEDGNGSGGRGPGLVTLEMMNMRHAVIENYGNRTRVMTFGEPPQFQSFEDFRNRYMNRLAHVGYEDGKPIFMQAGKFWLGDPQRRRTSCSRSHSGMRISHHSSRNFAKSG